MWTNSWVSSRSTSRLADILREKSSKGKGAAGSKTPKSLLSIQCVANMSAALYRWVLFSFCVGGFIILQRRISIDRAQQKNSRTQVTLKFKQIFIHMIIYTYKPLFRWNKSAYIVSFKGFCSMEFNIVSLFAFRTCLMSLCQCKIQVEYR